MFLIFFAIFRKRSYRQKWTIYELDFQMKIGNFCLLSTTNLNKLEALRKVLKVVFNINNGHKNVSHASFSVQTKIFPKIKAQISQIMYMFKKVHALL